MKKGFYKILIVIMSIALIGLIIIQFYWLNLTIKTGEETFNNNVYQAMNYATEKINKNEIKRQPAVVEQRLMTCAAKNKTHTKGWPEEHVFER